MKILNIPYAVLVGVLGCGFCILAASEDERGYVAGIRRDSSTSLSRASASPVGDGIFSLDTFLDNPRITLSDGKVLQVILSKDLKKKLEDERGLELQKITNSFIQYFEKTKSSKVSGAVIGFHFLLDDERVYRRTFLGENAK